MSRRRSGYLIAAVVILQIAVLTYMAVTRENILANGESVILQTAPVDPRDLFRGDYVTLEYSIATIGNALFDPFTERHPEIADDITGRTRQHTVYLQLEANRDRAATATSLQISPPAEGLFIKGQMGKGTGPRWGSNRTIKLGIEKYFVEQGHGLTLEETMGSRDSWQRPMEIMVKLGDDGTAVIAGYRWSKLSTRLEILRPGPNDNSEADNPRSPRVRFILRNDSDSALGLPIDPQHCDISIVAIDRAGGRLQTLAPANRSCDAYHQGQYSLQMLAPGAEYSTEIDFATAPWFVRAPATNSEVALDQLEAMSLFRVRYQPPPLHSARRAASAGNVWWSALASPRFTTSGRVD